MPPINGLRDFFDAPRSINIFVPTGLETAQAKLELNYFCPLFLAVTRRQILAPAKSVIDFRSKSFGRHAASCLLIYGAMNVPTQVAQTLVCEIPSQQSQTKVCATLLQGIKRRLARERRRRKVGRAYDMALEIARIIPQEAAVLDVGCGNGYIAHHLSAMLGANVAGIDVMEKTEAPIDYRRYDGKHFSVEDNSFDAVLLCYVLHHAQDVRALLDEVRRVLRDDGLVIIYEDIPRTWWDKGVCWIHNRQWKDRTGPCTFRVESAWRALFNLSGFAIVGERRLSRWRNSIHPVCRTLNTLRSEITVSGSRPCQNPDRSG